VLYGLDIKKKETHRLARELARATGESMSVGFAEVILHRSAIITASEF
jgi:hypothetical protein